ncbi:MULTISPECIES: type II toxin-antitoxin system RelE/ParE family toxin [unclassified Adlercreutzia]|uniref:type II toxin-antitoxin system RelE/ParE family toxin n=1 Tax=unclassified Adlercreutzia TaxID=2636013 RepID=UPI0013E9E07A|nr:MULTISPECIES: type II toxin-antitoxin system RelE/ParE family toxin [unclassified Adlercreutzia]
MLDLAWRPRAHLDRESIAIFLAVERSSPQAALAAMQSIDAALDMARRFPDAGGHFHHDNLEHEYRTALANPYTVFYRFDESTLTVYRILHQRQDLDAYSLVEF